MQCYCIVLSYDLSFIVSNNNNISLDPVFSLSGNATVSNILPAGNHDNAFIKKASVSPISFQDLS